MLKILTLFSCLATFSLFADSRCSEFDKTNHLYQSNHGFSAAWEQCGISAWGEAEQTTQCLVNTFPTLSHSCASCFGEYAGCVRSNCWWHCIGGRNQSCEECAINHCRAELEVCVGMPHEEMPSRS